MRENAAWPHFREEVAARRHDEVARTPVSLSAEPAHDRDRHPVELSNSGKP
jgi:hypothetical protein